MAFNAGSIQATLDLDRSPFQWGLEQAKSEAEKFTAEKIVAKLDLDKTAADKAWAEFTAAHADAALQMQLTLLSEKATSDLDAWKAAHTSVPVDVSLGLATGTADADLDAWKATHTSVPVDVALGVSTGTADAELAAWRTEQGNREINEKVTADTSQATSSMNAFGGRFNLMAAAIVAAAPFIGGALLAGVGGGMVALTALADKSNVQVKQSYTQLWQDVLGGTRQAAAQLDVPLIDAVHSIDANLQSLAPAFHAAFAAAGPDIVAVTSGINALVSNFLPGLVQGLQASGPAVAGLSALLGALGSAVGDTFGGLAQYSQAFGIDLQSLGPIVQSVLGAATTLVGVLGQAWATNAGTIDAAISNLAQIISGLGQGTLPVLTQALGVAAGALKMITDILGPIAPVIGTVGAAWLTLMAGMKLADLAKSGIEALANGMLNLGAQMDGGSKRAAQYIASVEGVAVESSVAATAMQAAGERAAEAAFSFSVAADALAGGLGIALVAGTALLGAFTSSTDSAAASTNQLSSLLNAQVSALEQSNGAADKQVQSNLQNNQSFQDLVKSTAAFGVSQQEVTDAILKGGPALDALQAKLQAIKDANHQLVQPGNDKSIDLSKPLDINNLPPSLNTASVAADKASKSLNDLALTQRNASDQAAANAKSQQSFAAQLVGTSDYQQAAAGSAQALGRSVSDVSAGFQAVIASGQASGASVMEVAQTYNKLEIAVTQAQASIVTHFKQVDQAVYSAQQSVDSAAHSYQQSIQGVTDAVHAYEQAQRAVTQAQDGVAQAQHTIAQAQLSLQDAYYGVTEAEKQYAQSQVTEQRAQEALNVAQQQAIQNLISLHLQLADQVTSQQQAQVALFDAQQQAAAVGIDATNAQQIAGEQVTMTNEAQVKMALSLIQAENALNDSMNAGVNLRGQVATADKQGVDQNPGVVAAQDALRNAQDQVAASARALQQAHQRVSDAVYALDQANQGLIKAQQQVADAAWNEQKAHQAVYQAQYQQQQAASQLTQAQKNLKDAQDAASRSLDTNTLAGSQNMQMLQTLWDAIQKTGMPNAWQYQTMVDDVATAFGMSKDKAKEFLDQAMAIKPEYKYKITAVSDVVTQNYNDLMNTLIGGGPNNQITSLGGLLGLPGHAAGGPIGGVGGPTEDANLIWASRGEYMQPADVVDHYGVPFMEALRQKKVSKDAAAPGFASGGLVDSAAVRLGLLGAMYQSDVIAMQVAGLPHPPLLPDYVPAPTGGGYGAVPAASGDAATAQKFAADHLAQFGWGPDQMAPLIKLWNQESGWNAWIVNQKSGAYGIPQSLGHGHVYDLGDYANQVLWGLNYIQGRYGSPAAAWNHEVAYNWYDTGGMLDPGFTLAYNGTGRSERIRTGEQEDALLTELRNIRSTMQGNQPAIGSLTVQTTPNASATDILDEATFRARHAGKGVYS